MLSNNREWCCCSSGLADLMQLVLFSTFFHVFRLSRTSFWPRLSPADLRGIASNLPPILAGPPGRSRPAADAAVERHRARGGEGAPQEWGREQAERRGPKGPVWDAFWK